MNLSKTALVAIFGGMALIVIIFLLQLSGVIDIFKTKNIPRGTLTLWASEPEEIWKPILEKVKGQLPGVKINFVSKPEDTLRQELIEAFASQQGPDIWIMPSELVRRDKDKILPLPFAPETFRNNYIDTAEDELIFDSQVWGLPISFNTLALYSNTDMLNSAGIAKAPSDWDEIKEATKFLTKRDDRGRITQSGIALGPASNIPLAKEIFLSLLWQQGGDVLSPDEKTVIIQEGIEIERDRIIPAQTTLSFLSEFSNPSLTHGGWLSTFKDSEEEFSKERVAMIIGDEKTQNRLLEKNPRLNFRITRFPQLRSTNKEVVFGKTKAILISKSSKNQELAWLYASTLVSYDFSQDYLSATFSLSPRRDLFNLQRQDDKLKTFADQMLIARSWPNPDPARINPILENMIDSVGIGRQTPSQAVTQVHQKLKLIIEGK